MSFEPITIDIQEEYLQEQFLDGTTGYCLACGEEAWGVEPDARKYKCDCCEERQVYGLSEILMMGLVNIVD